MRVRQREAPLLEPVVRSQELHEGEPLERGLRGPPGLRAGHPGELPHGAGDVRPSGRLPDVGTAAEGRPSADSGPHRLLAQSGKTASFRTQI